MPGSSVVCGIDPGLSSAHVAIFGYRETNRPRLVSVAKIPTTPDGKRIDVLWLAEFLKRESPNLAFVENATAMGAGTMSSYLKASGAIEAAVTLAGIHMVPVMPSVWMERLGVGADKKDSVRLARELFPEHAKTTFRYWYSHNAAQAALIALYGAIRADIVALKAA